MIHNAAYDLTGPAALSFPDVAKSFSKMLSRPIQYVPIDRATLKRTISARAPGWLADMAVGIDEAMQAGLHAETTEQLEQLTGKAPRTVEDFIRNNRAAFDPSR